MKFPMFEDDTKNVIAALENSSCVINPRQLDPSNFKVCHLMNFFEFKLNCAFI